jgi:hypothetical protein
MDIESKPETTRSIPRRFSLRSLVILMTLFCILFSVGALKIRQDRKRRAAITALQLIGFQHTIGSANGRAATWLRYTKSEYTDRNIESSLTYMKTIQQRYDLGISEGLEIKLIDFTDCHVSEHAISEFQAQFPDAEIRH